VSARHGGRDRINLKDAGNLKSGILQMPSPREAVHRKSEVNFWPQKCGFPFECGCFAVHIVDGRWVSEARICTSWLCAS